MAYSFNEGKAMDKGSQVILTLMRLPHGGYVVQDGFSGYGDRMMVQHFATASIDEALGFMRDAIKPIIATSDGRA